MSESCKICNVSSQEKDEADPDALLAKMHQKNLLEVDHTKMNYINFNKDFYIEVSSRKSFRSFQTAVLN